MSKKSPYDSVIVELPTDQLIVDYTYQRPLKRAKVAKIVKGFNVRRLGIIVVNQRDPDVQLYYVIDGQARVTAINRLENWPLTLRCELFVGLTYEDEAELYGLLDTGQERLETYDLFVGAFQSKNPRARAMAEAVAQAGMEISPNSGVGRVRAVRSLYLVFDRDGASILTRTLRILSRAWPDEVDAAPAPLIENVGIILAREADIDEKRLITVLHRTTPQAVAMTGRSLSHSMSSNTQTGMTLALTSLYNARLSPDRHITGLARRNRDND